MSVRLLIDIALVGIFAFSHSYLASEPFKSKFLEATYEPRLSSPVKKQKETISQMYRSTYVLLTSLSLEVFTSFFLLLEFYSFFDYFYGFFVLH